MIYVPWTRSRVFNRIRDFPPQRISQKAFYSACLFSCGWDICAPLYADQLTKDIPRIPPPTPQNRIFPEATKFEPELVMTANLTPAKTNDQLKLSL
jgi:hypothetical protein